MTILVALTTWLFDYVDSTTEDVETTTTLATSMLYPCSCRSSCPRCSFRDVALPSLFASGCFRRVAACASQEFYLSLLFFVLCR